MAVAAIIVGNDESQILQTREALSRLAQPVDEIYSVASLNVAELPHTEWVWPLAAGMEPLPDALAGMFATTEKSPSASWVLPKLVRADSPREILEYGLTATKLWRPLPTVAGEFDQSQHDHREDFLAATIYGSLLRTDALAAAGGFNQRTEGIARDYRIAVAMRLSGLRVLGAPKARIAIAGGAAGLAARSEFEVRKAQVQLASGFLNPLLIFIAGFFAPLGAILLAFWQVLIKRPEAIGASIGAGFWWFFNGIRLLARRPKLTSEQRSGLGALSVLFATREDRERSARSGFDQPAAIAEANLEQAEQAPGFFASGGLWYLLVLAGISWRFWPADAAVIGGGTLPLGQSLSELFNRAGASWQPAGFGLAAPSDPFGWVLFAFGALSFWAPSAALTVFIFLAKPLAFASAWRLMTLVTKRKLLLATGAFTYALWPALTTAQIEARIGTLVALVLLPVFAFTLARILQFGASPRRSVQTWTWVGISALLAAVISAGAPSLTPLVALVILLLAIYRFKRIGYLMWLPVPLLVIWIPLGWYLVVGLLHPLALLTDPGVAVSNPTLPLWQLMLGTPVAGPYGQWVSYATGVPLVLGLLAVFGRRSLNAMWLWLAMLASLAAALLLNRLVFHAASLSGGSDASNHGSPYALAGLAGMLAAVLLVLALDSAGSRLAGLGAGLALAASAVFGAQFALQSNGLSWGSGSIMPALVEAQAAANPRTETLVISSEASTGETERYSAQLVAGSGVHLQDLSTAYSYALPGLEAKDARYAQVAQLAANLISANGSDVDAAFKRYGIDYVLVAAGDNAAELGASLDTVSQLEPVGVTNLGRLYRVKASTLVHQDLGWQWSVTKQVQVAVLVIFGLLAIPTRRRTTAAAHDEEELDAFEGDFEREGY